MEFKGIAWAGNIYQKFEAMCLEVEEVMYQDTVTYFENQVQTVGASVKKFYSEVLEDFQPQSCVGPAKATPLNPYSHTKITKKLKKNIPEDHKEVLEHLETVIHSPMSNNECSELYNRKRKTGGLYRRPTAISKGSIVLSKMPSLSGPVLENPRTDSSFREMKNEVKLAPVKLNKGNCITEEKVRSINPLSESRDLVTDLSLESDLQTQDNSDSTTTITTTELSSETLDSATQDEPAICMESTINTITCASGDENVVLACEGKLYKDVESELEFVERLDESKFEESCVLVEENEVFIASKKETKHKSYKKKIREAFISKMKLTRKHEYEKLAAEYNKESVSSYEDLNRESEWEIL